MVDGTLKKNDQIEQEEKAFQVVVEDEKVKGKKILLLINKNVKSKFFSKKILTEKLGF